MKFQYKGKRRNVEKVEVLEKIRSMETVLVKRKGIINVLDLIQFAKKSFPQKRT